MIASSRNAAVIAFVLAVALHGAGALGLFTQQETQMEGSSGAQAVRFGASFADLAAGTLDATDTDSVAAPPEALAMAEPATVDRMTPTRTETVEPVEAPPTRDDPLLPEQRSEVVATSEKRDLAKAVAPSRSAPAESVAAALQPSMSESVAVAPEHLIEAESEPRPTDAADTPEDRIVATDPEGVAPEASSRPPPRRAPVRSEPESAQARRVSRGNSATDARKGSASGTTAVAEATASGAGGRVQEAGNAAANNYPGLVMRHLSRVPRPDVRSRGSAVVAFRLASNGALAGLTLASSSGSGALDRAAVGVVRRAAPFPAPPNGAQRSFKVEIEGR